MTSKKNKGKSVALPAIVGVNPTPFDEAVTESRDKAFSETTKADVRLRRKRNVNLVSAERHETYMGQLYRVPRSLEQNIALAKSKNKVRDIYKKPEVAALFDLAGADHEAMAHLSGPEATRLRTVVAYRVRHSPVPSPLWPPPSCSPFCAHFPTPSLPSPLPHSLPRRRCTSSRSCTNAPSRLA
jgi:hypothetical protein